MPGGGLAAHNVLTCGGNVRPGVINTVIDSAGGVARVANCLVRVSATLLAYARATACPVVLLLTRVAATVSAYAHAMPCPVLTYGARAPRRIPWPPTREHVTRALAARNRLFSQRPLQTAHL